MKLYTINEEYINFLKIFSENVKYNKNESRPYVGIVLKINEELSKLKLYVYEFKNENGVILTIMYYPEVQIKDVIKNGRNYQNIIYNGNEVSDFISINSNNSSFIEYYIEGIKEK